MAPITSNAVAAPLNSTLGFAAARLTQAGMPAPVAYNITVASTTVSIATSGNNVTTSSRSNGMPPSGTADDTRRFEDHRTLIIFFGILCIGVILLMIRRCTMAAYHPRHVASSHDVQPEEVAGPKHPRLAKLLASMPFWGPFYLYMRKKKASSPHTGGSNPVLRVPISQALERQSWSRSLGLGAANASAPSNMTSWYTRQPAGSCMPISERFRIQAADRAVEEGRALDERGESIGPVTPQAALPYTSATGRSLPVVVGLQTPPPSYTRQDPSS